MRGKILLSVIASTVASLTAFGAPTYSSEPVQYELRIERQSLSRALQEFAKQSGVQIIFFSKVTDGHEAPPLSGKFTATAALNRLLNHSQLTFRELNPKTIEIQPRAAVNLLSNSSAESPLVSRALATAMDGSRSGRGLDRARLAASEPKSRSDSSPDDSGQKSDTQAVETVTPTARAIPEVLVKGSRSLNVDIQRTEDDIQPYVVFNREEIEKSMAGNLEDFLRGRLPMNTSSSSRAQTRTFDAINTSSINLRGLGTDQTLILVDGRRMPNTSIFGSDDYNQPDINGIPLAAIERIEVLPSTASGIYGGGATGGVINIVMRRDYAGIEAKVTYENTFDTDVSTRRFDMSGGFSLEGGRTQITMSASHSDGNRMLVGDRDFAERSRALQLHTNPAAITDGFNPPLGATVNIRSNLTVNGVLQPLVLKPAYGGSALGSTITHIPLGYEGVSSDNGQALIANAGNYNLSPPTGMQGSSRSLINNPIVKSAALNLRRGFTRHFDAFVDLWASENLGRTQFAQAPTYYARIAADAPANPFQQAILISFPTPNLLAESQSSSQTYRATSGLLFRLPHDWAGELSYGWSRSRATVNYLQTPIDRYGRCYFSDGNSCAATLGPHRADPQNRPPLDMLQEQNTYPLDLDPYRLDASEEFGPYLRTLLNGTVRLSGPVFNIYGGPVMLSALFERRDDKLHGAASSRWNADFSGNFQTHAFLPEVQHDAKSAYVEVRAPLVSAANALPWVRELELQIAVRRDEYRTRLPEVFSYSMVSREGPFQDVAYRTNSPESTDYTAGIRFAPLKFLTLRASFGTGFVPPGISELRPCELVFSTPSNIVDPKRGRLLGSEGPYVQVFTGNPNLQPETSKSWSAGAILTPDAVPGLRISVDYTSIKKADEIAHPGSTLFYFENEDALPGRIQREPLSAADAALGLTGGIITRLDTSLMNIANMTMKAIDIQIDYDVHMGKWGRFHPYVVATQQWRLARRTLPESPLIDAVGYRDGPLEWRGNIGLDWQRNAWTLGWNAQFYDSYLLRSSGNPSSAFNDELVRNQGSETIPSQIYHDVHAVYRFDRSATFMKGFLDNTEIMLGIRNVFDKSPPILAEQPTGSSLGTYSTYGDPRLRRYTLSFRKGF